MTDQPTEPSTPTSPATPTTPSTEPDRPKTFEERIEDFGRRAEAAGERFGRDAEAAAHRWTKDPAVVGAADAVARTWGLFILAVGLWFFADITVGLDMPSIAWRDLWPVALIVIGLVVIVRGIAGRRT